MGREHDSLLLLITDSLFHGFPPGQLPMFFHFVDLLEQHLDSANLFVPFVCLSETFPTVLTLRGNFERLQKMTSCNLAGISKNKDKLGNGRVFPVKSSVFTYNKSRRL